MKKIIIDNSRIREHETVDVSLLQEGFIFNDFGLIIQNLPGFKHDFKIHVIFQPERCACLIGVWGPDLKVITYYFGYNKLRGFEFGNCDKDITKDQEEIDASYQLISLVMDACMTMKEDAYDRAINYKKHPDEKTADISDIKDLKKIKKRHKMSDIYLIDDLIVYAALTVPEEKLKRHFNCPVWEVRGFYRHYKNGTVKWINGFQKGRDRNKGLSGKDRTYIADKRDKNI